MHRQPLHLKWPKSSHWIAMCNLQKVHPGEPCDQTLSTRGLRSSQHTDPWPFGMCHLHIAWGIAGSSVSRMWRQSVVGTWKQSKAVARWHNPPEPASLQHCKNSMKERTVPSIRSQKSPTGKPLPPYNPALRQDREHTQLNTQRENTDRKTKRLLHTHFFIPNTSCRQHLLQTQDTGHQTPFCKNRLGNIQDINLDCESRLLCAFMSRSVETFSSVSIFLPMNGNRAENEIENDWATISVHTC